jgi:hypothetical protein
MTKPLFMGVSQLFCLQNHFHVLFALPIISFFHTFTTVSFFRHEVPQGRDLANAVRTELTVDTPKLDLHRQEETVL